MKKYLFLYKREKLNNRTNNSVKRHKFIDRDRYEKKEVKLLITQEKEG